MYIKINIFIPNVMFWFYHCFNVHIMYKILNINTTNCFIMFPQKQKLLNTIFFDKILFHSNIRQKSYFSQNWGISNLYRFFQEQTCANQFDYKPEVITTTENSVDNLSTCNVPARCAPLILRLRRGRHRRDGVPETDVTVAATAAAAAVAGWWWMWRRMRRRCRRRWHRRRRCRRRRRVGASLANALCATDRWVNLFKQHLSPHPTVSLHSRNVVIRSRMRTLRSWNYQVVWKALGLIKNKYDLVKDLRSIVLYWIYSLWYK